MLTQTKIESLLIQHMGALLILEYGTYMTFIVKLHGRGCWDILLIQKDQLNNTYIVGFSWGSPRINTYTLRKQCK